MLILVLAANTSFADFPRLASFQAGDNFMPRQLTKRGHRLVFSNGIIVLAVAAIVLLVVTGAKVERLIPLYAIGVFTGFTLSQAGMAKHHIRHKEPGWRAGWSSTASAPCCRSSCWSSSPSPSSPSGAWVIIVLIPSGHPALPAQQAVRDGGRRAQEDAPRRRRGADPATATSVIVLHRHARHGRGPGASSTPATLMPDELAAVHFDLDPIRTEELTDAWARLGFARLPLDVVDCPDRRIERGPPPSSSPASWPTATPR